MSSLTTYPPTSSGSLSPAPVYTTSSRLAEVYPGHTPSHDTEALPLTQLGIKRSGSPTPSEVQELKQLDGIVQRAFRKESWKDREFRITFIALVVILAIVIVIAVFQDQIVIALTPAAEWVKQAPGGFLIPIAFLVILSIPPLFGAEIIHLLCGFIYGLGIGFVVVCVGTVIGESITYFAFRSCLRSRAEKLERGSNGSIRWPALARVIREGGFIVALVVRYSAIPTHISTTLFAVCGITFRIFLATLVLSLPRQLAGVYIGVLALDKANGKSSTLDKKISMIVLAATIVVTIFAMKWIAKQQKRAGLAIIRERRAQANAETYSGMNASGSMYPSPNVQVKSMAPVPALPAPSPARMDV